MWWQWSAVTSCLTVLSKMNWRGWDRHQENGSRDPQTAFIVQGCNYNCVVGSGNMKRGKWMRENSMEEWNCDNCLWEIYCHPAYLAYMQSTSWETLGWMKHKLESRLPGEISITSYMQMTPPLWEKVKRNFFTFFLHSKEPIDESERGEWKSRLKSQYSEY